LINTQINTDILNSAISLSLDKITHIEVLNVGGAFFRKALTDSIEVNTRKRVFTFFITEDEANTNITEVKLFGGTGCTTSFGTGTLYATQTLVLTKTNTQSLLIDWTIELV
jgi:hypothetical protein